MDDRVWLVSCYTLSTVRDMKSSSIKTCYTASEYVIPNPVTVFVYGMGMFPQCLKTRIIRNSTMILSYTHIQPLPAIFRNKYTSCTCYESGEVVPSKLTIWQLNFAYPACKTTYTISLRHL